ncbi:MAG: class I SAM-dependent methyltransferase [Thermoanaerobaculia bacterium]
MLVPFLPPPRSSAVEDLLGEIPRDLFSERLYQACELVERYVSDWAVAIAQRLGLEPELAQGTTAQELLRARGYPADESPALAWLLARLAAAGHLERADTPQQNRGQSYRLPRPLPTPELAELRALGLAIDPAIAPTLAILDAAGEAFPGVLAGTLTGEQALFTSTRMPLWTDYFHNANPIYAVNNRMASIAAANRLPATTGGWRILEIGAGAGSAAEALLDEIRGRGRLEEIAEYRLTEPNPMLRRRATRTLAARYPGLRLTDQAYDIDHPPAGQSLSEAGFDLVYAVNVLHIARDLRASLEWLRSLLVPGGWLVGGECQRLFPGQTIPIELIFEQLASFTDVALDPEVRSSHGFLTPEQWHRALAATGFIAVSDVPDLARIREHYPRFFSGALCARRPPTPDGLIPRGG